MPKKPKNGQPELDDVKELKKRLEETEETLRAIRQYMVDAFVVTRVDAEDVQVVTLADADFPYRRMVESMNEGAVTIIPDGSIFYCNPRFSRMVQTEREQLIGVQFADLLPDRQRAYFRRLLQVAGENGSRGEFCLGYGEEDCLPIQLSFYQLGSGHGNGIAIIATDISERKQSEEKIRTLASELTIAEQQERQRISQVLHDDLQQRLFAMRAQLSFMLESVKSDPLPSDMKESIDQLQSSLIEVITITRNLSVDISPVVLQDDGIKEALYWLCARMKEQHGLQAEIDIKDNFERVPDSIRVTLFQTIRELLFNVVKHADTLRANLTAEKLNGKGVITITDSGSGFEAQTVMKDPQTAHGLMIVRDRLKLMGGTLEIESAVGKGTRARIEFPIEDPST